MTTNPVKGITKPGVRDAIPDRRGNAAENLGQSEAGAPLASWNDGAAKRSILDFVRRVTTTGGPDFVPPSHRIAVFDNDGTLWAEQPFYFQGLFALDRVRALAPQHPGWKDRQPFKAALENDVKSLATLGMSALVELVMATHAGMTTEEFEHIVEQWLGTARPPTLDRPYTDLVYGPMLELLAFLRAAEFTTFIITGGGIEFVRVFSENAYGIPPEQVMGSSIVTKYERRHGKPAPDRGLRQLGWGFRDARMGDRRPRASIRASGAPRRWRAGIRVRPDVSRRQACPRSR